MGLALFCFTGHWSNPILTESSSENIDFHDFRVLEPLGNLICEFEYTKFLLRNSKKNTSISENICFKTFQLGN